MLSLVGIFLTQTWLVYSDDAGRVRPPLSITALEGRDLWHDHNCQSCHQLFGFGGFLGPDLTNLARRLTPEANDEELASADQEGTLAPPLPSSVLRRIKLADRLEAALTTGSDRMPPFHFDVQERRAFAAYLIEIDRMGVGQVRRSEARPPRELFASTVQNALPPAVEWTEEQRQGLAISLDRGCIDCHLPNAQSNFRATDLTRIDSELGADHVALILRDGVPRKGMPAFNLQEEEIASVRAFLALLAEHGTIIRSAFEANENSGSASVFDLPWFEYNQ